MEARSRRRVVILWAMLALAPASGPTAAEPDRVAPPLPSEPSRWVGRPQTWDTVRGRVGLVFVWTFGCVNCTRTAPWVRAAVERHSADGLVAIGVHTPEFEQERNPAAVAAHARRLGLDFPHVFDPDFQYWRALGNEYWPTVYLVDRCGRIRYEQIGEVHDGQPSGRKLEAQIETLLAEAPGCR